MKVFNASLFVACELHVMTLTCLYKAHFLLLLPCGDTCTINKRLYYEA